MRSLRFLLLLLLGSCDTLTEYDDPNKPVEGCDVIQLTLDSSPITLNGEQIFRGEVAIDSLFDFSEVLQVFADGATLDTVSNGAFTSKSIAIDAFNYRAEFLYLPDPSQIVDIDLTVKLNNYFCSELHETFTVSLEEPEFITLSPSSFSPNISDTLTINGTLIDENNSGVSDDLKLELHVFDTLGSENSRFWNPGISFSKDSKVEFKLLKLDTIPERIKILVLYPTLSISSDTLFITYSD